MTCAQIQPDTHNPSCRPIHSRAHIRMCIPTGRLSATLASGERNSTLIALTQKCARSFKQQLLALPSSPSSSTWNSATTVPALSFPNVSQRTRTRCVGRCAMIGGMPADSARSTGKIHQTSTRIDVRLPGWSRYKWAGEQGRGRGRGWPALRQ